MTEAGISVGTFAAYFEPLVCTGGGCIEIFCGGEARLLSEVALDSLGEYAMLPDLGGDRIAGEALPFDFGGDEDIDGGPCESTCGLP